MEALKKTNSLGTAEIATVTHTLLTLESVILSIGIPIVPQNSKRQQLRSTYFSPTEDFVKSSLVTVNTPKLIEFIKLLESTDDDSRVRLKELYNVSYIEMIFFPLIIFALIFSFVFSIMAPHSVNIFSTIISSAVSALGASASSFLTITNQYRFHTFRQVLSNELDRRQGHFGSFPTRKIQISSLSMSQINDEEFYV